MIRNKNDVQWYEEDFQRAGACGGIIKVVAYPKEPLEISFPKLFGLLDVTTAQNEDFQATALRMNNVSHIHFGEDRLHFIEMFNAQYLYLEGTHADLVMNASMNENCDAVSDFYSPDNNVPCGLSIASPNWATNTYNIDYNGKKIVLDVDARPEIASLEALQQFHPSNLSWIRLQSPSDEVKNTYKEWLRSEGFVGTLEICRFREEPYVADFRTDAPSCSEVTTFTPDGPVDGLVLPEATAEEQNE